MVDVVVARIGASDGEVTVNSGPVPGPAGGGVERYADPNRLLLGPECAAMLGISASTWRSLRTRPAPDESNPRAPRWKLSTLAEYARTRRRRVR